MIVGKILIEGADQPITVGVGVGVAALFLKDVAFGIGITGDVHPAAGLAFPKSWSGQETVHQLGHGLGRGIGDEGLDFLKGGWQAGEVEAGAADQGSAVSFRGKGQSGFFEERQHVAIEWLADAGAVPERWHGWRDDGLEGPMLPPFFCRRRGGLLLRPRKALLNPIGQNGNGVRRQFVRLFWHRLHALCVLYGLDQLAAGGISLYRDGTVVAPSEDGGPGIEAQAIVLFVWSVAGIAFFREERTDFSLEGVELLSREGGGG